ncbi:MAG: AraC family transcriptional regulator [Succinivibrio sp.]
MNTETESKIKLLASKVKQQIKTVPSRYSTRLAGLTYSCLTGDSRVDCFYHPCIVCVLQGGKNSIVGDRKFMYKAGSCFVVNTDIPSTYSFVDVSLKSPFISMTFELDKEILSSLFDRVDLKTSHNVDYGASLNQLSDRMIDVLISIAELEANGSDLDLNVLRRPLFEQFFYYVISSSHGAYLYAALNSSAISSGIQECILYLRKNYKKELNMEMIAKDIAFMQPSTFFKNFKKVTGLSPLQYKKRLSLVEAKRLIVEDRLSATAAAYEVGYKSISQFSRDFKEVFEIPPSKLQK